MKQRLVSDLIAISTTAVLLFLAFPTLLRMSMRWAAWIAGVIAGRETVHVWLALVIAIGFVLAFGCAGVALRAALRQLSVRRE